MADKTLSVKIKAEDGASAEFRKVGDSAKTMAQALEQAGKSSGSFKTLKAEIEGLDGELNRAGAALSLIGAGGVAVFGAAATASMGFTSAMANVNSIARMTTQELSGMEQAILRMSSAYGAGPTELAEGLYEIVSSGFEATEALNILEAAVVAAGAGMTSTNVSATAITAVLNAYGMSADKAGDVSDVLFKVVDSGVISFEALARNMGNTLPVASRLGVSIEELGAAYAELTLQGINASAAETGIAAVMRATIAPTEELTTAVQEYGYASAEALIQAEGFSGFLQFLAEASGGSVEGMRALLGTQEAVTAALALGRNEGESYAAMLETMGGAAQDGAGTLEVFGVQMANASGAVRMASAEMQVAAINLGSALEPLVAYGAGALDGILSAFNALPAPAQAAVTYIGAVGSAATLLTGGLLLAVPKVVEFVDAIGKIRASQNLVGLLATVGRFTAIGAAATVATVAVAGLYSQTQDMVEASENLTAAWRNLMIAGETDLAGDLKEVREQINGIISDLEGGIDLPGGWTTAFFEDLTKSDNVSNEIREGISTNLRLALEDSRVDAEAFFSWINTEIASIGSDPEAQRAFLQELADPNVLIQFGAAADDAADGVDAIDESAVTALRSIQELRAALGDLPGELDRLRMEGEYGLAAQMERASEAILRGFMPTPQQLVESRDNWLELVPPAEELQRALDMTETISLNEDQIGQLGSAWERITSGMQSGLLDNVAVVREINEILSDTSMSPQQQIDAIDALSSSLSEYRDHAKAMREEQIAFLENGDNLLAWWENYTAAINQGAAAFDGTEEQLAALNARMAEQAEFRGLVDFVQDLESAGDALDSVLRTYERIDSLAQRSASAGSIAENLVGTSGEWAAIDDLVTNGRISWEQYNEVVEAGYGIMESNVRVQEHMNKIRADQLPLLAEEQAAYEQQIAALSELPALEQRRALALQDSAVQAQVASLYSQAYAASVGEIPREVATDMIVSAAEADPVIKDLLENFGLIEEGADGEIRVNFPDADATVSAINRLTIAFLELEGLASGVSGFELAVEIYGEEEAMELYGLVKEADGTYSKATLAVDTEGAEEAESALREVTLADGTVVQVKVEADTTGWEDLTAAELAEKFGNDPVQLPVEAVVQPMDGVTDEEWNAMLGPFPEVGIPTALEPPEERNWAQDGYTGGYVPVTGEVTDVEVPGGTTAAGAVPVDGEVTAVTALPNAGTGTTVTGLEGEVTSVTVASGAVEGARAALMAGLAGALGGDAGLEDQSITITADDQASGVIQEVIAAATAIPEVEIVNVSVLGAYEGSAALNGVTTAAQAIPEAEMVNVFVFGAGAAVDALNSVANAAASIPDSVSTTITTNRVTVYSTVGDPRTGGRGGGIVGNLSRFAGGGMVEFIGGEAGPELAHFVGGGLATLPVHGIYSAPAGTYISPAHTTASSAAGGGGPRPINVYNYGTIVGVDDLTEVVARAMWEAEAAEEQRYSRAHGGMSS